MVFNIDKITNICYLTITKVLQQTKEDKTTKSTKDFNIKDTVLVKYTGTDKEVIVPEGITEIGKDAFYDCKTIERVILPKTLKTIGVKAFFASGITSVDIPDSVERVENLAFCCCRKLEQVTLGASVKYIGRNAFDSADVLRSVTFNYGLAVIDAKAFESCYSLRNVVFSSGLLEIGESAFGYTNLTDVIIPASVQTIASGAFARCDISTFKTEEGSPFNIKGGCLIDTANKKLIAGCTKSVIPEDGSVTSIATGAFCGYFFGDEEYVTIPLAVKVIDKRAFSDCQNLRIRCKEDEFDADSFDEQWYEHPEPWENEYYDEDNDEIIRVSWGWMSPEERAEKDRIIREKKEAEERFRLSQLNDYIRENGVMTKYVGESGDVVIPSDVKIIRAHAFDDCDNITSVKIHYFVQAVEEKAFDKFKGKECQFYFQADKSPKGFGAYRFKSENLHFNCLTDKERKEVEERLVGRKEEELALRGFVVENGAVKAYNGTDTHVILPYNDVTRVHKAAFKDNDKIVSVHFGSIDEIWDCAFENCVNLEKVILPDTLKSFGNAVFSNCEKLNIERFPALTKSIGAGAFSNTGLENIELDVEFVGNGAFSHCKKLKKVVLNHDGHTSLRWQAFHDCCRLEEVELNYEAKEIEWGMFEGCFSLKSVKLPKNLQIIGNAAFKDCSSLSSIEIPSTVTEIQSQAFLNCKALQNLTIPNSVTEIGDGAFLGCSGWTLRTTITLPKRFEKDIRRIFGEWKDSFQFNDGPIFKFI